MKVMLLLWVRKQTFLNRYKISKARKKVALMGMTTILILGTIMFFCVRILLHFRSVPIIGDYLGRQLLNMSYLTIFGMIIFSAINVALVNLYISKDLEFLNTSPLSAESIFLGRSLVSIIDSSWMAILFFIPILTAYGLVYRPGTLFYVKLVLHTPLLVIIGGFIGIIITTLLVSVLPAKRVRDIIVILGILFFIAIYVLFRTIRPEQLVNPDTFMDVTEYVSYLSSPYMAVLPSRWVTESLWNAIHENNWSISLTDLLVINTLLFLFLLSLILARHLYRSGFSKALEGRSRHPSAAKALYLISKLASFPYQRQMKAIVEKDIKLFFRDNTQWTQLLLLGALIFVYIYNFSVLPVHKSPIRIEYLQNVLGFLNLGLTLFIISALGARFVYPSISIEGEGFWLLRSSPMNVAKLIYAKFFFYFTILAVLGVILVVTSNIFLCVDKMLMSVTCISCIFLTFSITALAIGFGCIYPVFRYENLANITTGFGAFTYMLASSILIVVCIIIEATALYTVIKRQMAAGFSYSDISLVILSLIVIAVISLSVGFYILRKGINKLDSIEQF